MKNILKLILNLIYFALLFFFVFLNEIIMILEANEFPLDLLVNRNFFDRNINKKFF